MSPPVLAGAAATGAGGPASPGAAQDFADAVVAAAREALAGSPAGLARPAGRRLLVRVPGGRAGSVVLRSLGADAPPPGPAGRPGTQGPGTQGPGTQGPGGGPADGPVAGGPPDGTPADGTPAGGPGPDHELLVWDSADGRPSPPPRPWGPEDHAPLGVVRGFSAGGVRCALDVHTSALVVQDLAAGVSVVWYPSMADLPAWALASPARIPLAWWANTVGLQVVHGAAVAHGGRAALLLGDGGSGKSSTALACAAAGMDYLGDDYCLVEPAAGRVHLLYTTAKLQRDSLARMPHLRPYLLNPDRVDPDGVAGEKAVLGLAGSPWRLGASAEVAVLLLPSPRPGGTGPAVPGPAGAGPADAGPAVRLRPATSAAALGAVLPSTVGGLMGGTPATPGLLLRLARSAPAAHLDLAWDPPAVVAAVRGALGGVP